MIFRVTPAVTFVEGRIPLQAMEALSTALRYRPRGYAHSAAFKRHVWDGWKSLLKRRGPHTMFPSGVLPVVQAALGQVHADVVNEIPNPRPSIAVDTLPDGLQLYADQIEAINIVRERHRGLLALATNFGKTELIAGIIQAFPGCRALVLGDTGGLMEQTAKRLAERLRRTVAKFGSGYRPRMSDTVVVATIQSCHAHVDHPRTQEWLQSFDVLLVDEVHTVSPNQWFPTLTRCPAPVRIGLSGSVHDSDQKLTMQAFFGPVLMTVREDTLVGVGRSAEPIILMPYTASVVPSSQDFREVYRPGIVENGVRNQLIVEAVQWCVANGLRTLVICYQLDHVKWLVQGIERLRLPGAPRVVGLHGGMELERAKDALMRRKLDVIVGSGVFNKGHDLPALEVLINAAAWKSPVLTGQRLGRVLRRKPDGANRAILIDPFDLGNGTLKKHAHGRERTYTKKGFVVHKGSLADLLAAHGSGLVQPVSA